MDSKKSNKIREIVRLQQLLKKWKKLANNNAITTNSSCTTTSSGTGSGSRSMKFLKRTLSFTDVSSLTTSSPPKGSLAVSVGEERKRFVIPTEYLGHQAFRVLLRKAEEEFGFQQEGVLRIPCEVSVFEKILEMVELKKDAMFLHEFGFNVDADMIASSCSPDAELTPSSHQPQTCR
ncbi:hypothetical protein Gohar_025777 [Gossypium harknessii]|uniref:Auxin-responsive protein SAUR72-like n=1 Tax=Gossypium harknessii TaxID=34285 RepID=A0A7J9HQ61_9ROSI|nr:hypothetical protein [Gossypium harknessii]